MVSPLPIPEIIPPNTAQSSRSVPAKGEEGGNVHRKNGGGNQVGGKGIDRYGIGRAQSKAQTLPAEAVKKDRDVEDEKKQGKGVFIRSHEPEQHGCAGDAAVIQAHGSEKHRNADGVDNSGCGQQRIVTQIGLAFLVFFIMRLLRPCIFKKYSKKTYSFLFAMMPCEKLKNSKCQNAEALY